MSSYSASKICKARIEHKCDNCDKQIAKGERYLRYHLSHGITYPLHLAPCAQKRAANNSLVFDCAALRTELNLPVRRAV